MLGLVVICVLILLAIFAPLIAPFDPAQQSWTAVRKAAVVGALVRHG